MIRSVSSQIAVCFCALSLFAGPGFAQEHPAGSGTSQKSAEHPSDKEKSEHPDKSGTEGTTTASVALQDVSKAITNHVKQKASDGKLALRDPKTNEDLSLELVKVHEDKLARTGENTYFACVDMKAANGKMYDIDFFLTGTSPETLKVTESSVHKVDGQPRYTWKEEAGIWKKQEIVESKPGSGTSN